MAQSAAGAAMKALFLGTALALFPAYPMGAEERTVEGEIVLTDSPFCEFFVVLTDRGFSLLDWRAGMYVFAEGDRVRGALHEKGRQEIEIINLARLTAMVEASGVAAEEARKTYYRRCKLDQPGPKRDFTIGRR
jgi:hypothetical protein